MRGGNVAGPIREPAPAKLNPFLRVLGPREDGYHDVETLVLPLTLADGVEATAASGLSVAVVGPRAAGVPTGDENLVLRAARALAEEAGVDPRARLLVAKNVPVGAGLGGGSADAAAALRALNDLWGCGLRREELAPIGADVGSDVPALVHAAPAVARGRGEVVEPVAVPRTWWVLIGQDYEVSAADAYSWWDQRGDTGRPAGVLLDALRQEDVAAVAALLRNDLEGPVAARHPEISHAGARLLAAGAVGSIMCGSGPTVAGLCRDAPHAEEVAGATGGTVVASLPGRPSRQVEG